MKRLFVVCFIILISSILGYAQLPIFPCYLYAYGKVKSIKTISGSGAGAFVVYDTAGRIISYEGGNVSIKINWNGNEIIGYFAEDNQNDPRYQYSYLEYNTTRGFAFYNSLSRWTCELDDKQRIKSSIRQYYIDGGYIMSYSVNYSYNNNHELLPSRYIDSNGNVYVYKSLKLDPHNNATQFSITDQDGHTEINERVIEYYD